VRRLLGAARRADASLPPPFPPSSPRPQLEGIIPALETSHALAYLEKLCPTLPNGTRVVLNLRCGTRAAPAGGRAAAGPSPASHAAGSAAPLPLPRTALTSHPPLCPISLCPRSGRGDKDVNTAIKALGMQTSSI
jgi:hypothetical protein